MAELLKGAPVAKAINERTCRIVEDLAAKNIIPTLAILRAGERKDDISYENSAVKKCDAVGINVKKVVLPEDISADEFYDEIRKLNEDEDVHGILMFRPLPGQIDEDKARNLIDPSKDIDCCTNLSLAGVFSNTDIGYPPCTAQAVIEMLDYYDIPVKGKNAAILGRSLVIGRPVAMMLMHKNATPTICHTKTVGTADIAKASDIVIACTGHAESVGKEFFTEGQTVIDVGINWSDKKNKLCGDVDLEAAEPVVANITPVPGGVGAVTTAVLLFHVADSAMKRNNRS